MSEEEYGSESVSIGFEKQALAKYVTEAGEEYRKFLNLKEILESENLDLGFVVDRILATSNLSNKQIQAAYTILDYAKEAYLAFKSGFLDMIYEFLDAIADLGGLLELNKSKGGFQQQTIFTKRVIMKGVGEEEEKSLREKILGGEQS